MAMFFSANTINSSNGGLNLASLLGVNSANAECNDATYNAYCYTGSSCTLGCGGVFYAKAGKSNTPL